MEQQQTNYLKKLFNIQEYLGWKAQVYSSIYKFINRSKKQ